MFTADIPQILRIEKAVQVSPWTEETFRVCFHAGYLGWLIEVDKIIVGYVIVAYAADECHILNVCVDHAFQRQGLGEKLLEYVLNQATQRGTMVAWLEVRRSNSRAISFYQKMHFQQIGERKGYYPTVSGQEDALIFAKQLSGSNPLSAQTILG